MGQHYRRSLAIALIILAVAGPAARAQSIPPGDCGTEVETLNREWRWTWPKLPSPKPGNNAFIEDRQGHRYSVTEYEAMHRRLDRSRRLCRNGAVDEAKTEMTIVRGWLNADNDPAAQINGLVTLKR